MSVAPPRYVDLWLSVDLSLRADLPGSGPAAG